MKLLTAMEYDLLLDAAQPCDVSGPTHGQLFSAAEDEAANGLIKQGRITEGPCPCGGHDANWITPAGREALRMWPAIRAVLEGQ